MINFLSIQKAVLTILNDLVNILPEKPNQVKTKEQLEEAEKKRPKNAVSLEVEGSY